MIAIALYGQVILGIGVMLGIIAWVIWTTSRD